MSPSSIASLLHPALRLALLLGVVSVSPLILIQQSYAQGGYNPGPGDEAEDPDNDEEDEKPDEKAKQRGSTGEDGTYTNDDGEGTTPSEERESGPGNSSKPVCQRAKKDCGDPDPTPPSDPDDPDDPNYRDYPESDTDPTPSPSPSPKSECFTQTFKLFGPGALASGSVRFFTHEFRNPGRLALRAVVPPSFTVNTTTWPYPGGLGYTYKRLNFIDTGAMRIEFADAPPELLALDPNAFTATEKNAAGQQERKTTISFVEESGTNYFRMDVEEFGSVTRHEQTRPVQNTLVLESGSFSGGVFSPIRRVTTIKNFDNPYLRKERVIMEERASASHAFQVTSDREFWREAFMKPDSAAELGLKEGPVKPAPPAKDPKPPIEEGSDVGFVKDSSGNAVRRHTPNHSWRIVREIIDPEGPQPKTNAWSYYNATDTGVGGYTPYGIGLIRQYLMHDGRKGTYSYAHNRETVVQPYAGDPDGLVTVAVWNPGTRTRTITATANGQTLSRTVTVYTDTSATIQRQTGSGPALTTVKHYVPDGQMFGGFPTRIQRPDGTLTTYAYTRTSVGGIRTVTEKGATADGTSVSEGIRTTTVTNSRGREILREVQAIGHGSADGLVYDRMAVTAVDDRGRPTTIAWHPESASAIGEVAAATNPAWQTTIDQFCCGPTAVTDRYGITTYYAYDSLKNQIKSNRLGVTTETVRNGLTTESHRYAETVTASLSPALQGTAATLVSRDVRNLTGTLRESWSPDPTSATPGALVKTSTATTHLPATGLSTRTVTTTSDNFSQTTDSFLDGRTAATYGDLSPAMQYAYSVNATGEVMSESYVDGATLRETTTTQSDQAGRTLRVDYMDGAFATMEYNPLGQMVKSTDPDGVTTLMAYNAEGERTLTAIDLNANGAIDHGTDTVHFSDSFPATDGLGMPVMRSVTKVWQPNETDPTAGTVVSTSTRSPDGLSSSSQSIGVANPSTSLTALGGSGNWTTIRTSPDNTYTVTTYVDGLVDKSENFGADDALISFASMRDSTNDPLSGYDDLNRPTHQRDSRTGVSVTAYLSATADVVTSVADPGGRITAFTYDVRRRRISVNAPDTLDADGNTLTNVTNTSYFADGNVDETSGAQTYRTTHTYDYADRMLSMTTYGTVTATTTWIYSPTRGFLTEKKHAGETDDGTTDADYTYTPAGRLLTRTWERGVTTSYGYDSGGRLTLTDYSDSTPDVTMGYDALGRQLTLSNGLATSTFAYNPDNLAVDAETLNYDLNADSTIDFTRVIDRSQDSLGRDSGWKFGTLAQYNAGWVDGNEDPDRENAASYNYGTADGRLEFIGNGSDIFSYTYHANSNLISSVAVTTPASAPAPAHTVTNTYEASRNALDTKVNRKLDDSVISAYDYGVNEIGQRTGVAKSGSAFDTARNIAWGYDALGQVTKADSTITALDRGYRYDMIGNRLKSVEETTDPDDPSATAYTPNVLNQYDAIGALTPSYDEDGNMTGGPLPASPGAGSTLAWDGENRLIQAQVSGGNTVTYIYDAQSRRIAETVGTATTVYVYDGWNPIAEYGTSYALTKTYTWGLDLSGTMQGAGGVGGLLSVTDGTGTYYPTYDGNGNVSEYLDAAGAVVAHYEYDPFGRTTVASEVKAEDFAHRFSTKPLDGATGLYYYGYRYYDSTTGRWPSRDPIGERGGVNLYGFVWNDVFNWLDILGGHPLKTGAGNDVWHAPHRENKKPDPDEEAPHHERAEKAGLTKVEDGPNGTSRNCFNQALNHDDKVDTRILDPDVILKDDYNEVKDLSNVKEGDVVMYRDANGAPIHAGKVTGKDKSGEPIVISKLGSNGTYTGTAGATKSYYSDITKTQYYTPKNR